MTSRQERSAREQIARDLETLRTSGTFITRRFASPGDLFLQVQGAGPIRLPVTPTQARKLRDVARPAKFGWRDKTLLDPRVRNTWEIARSRVKIDQRKWKATLGNQLKGTRQELGLPDGGALTAELYKLLVYEPGQFFSAHQDSEKSSQMVGTLTVTLPSTHRGGTAVIEHHGEKVTYRTTSRSERDLTFVAFYSDCHHEVRPIEKGFRVVLVYNLLWDGPAHRLEGASDERSVETLIRSVEDHFKTPVSHGYLGMKKIPDKLVYLLDHRIPMRARIRGRADVSIWPEGNVLIPLRVDPISGEPDYNAVVRIEKIGGHAF